MRVDQSQHERAGAVAHRFVDVRSARRAGHAAASSCPPRTANRNGVNASLFRARVDSAPASISALAAAALFSAGRPHERGLPLPCFPWRSDRRRAPAAPARRRRSPLRAAVISAVSPSGDAVFGSAPADSSRSMAWRAAVGAGEIQRRHAVSVRGVDVRAGANQPVRRLPDRFAARPECSGVVPSGSGWRWGLGAGALEAAVNRVRWRRSEPPTAPP